MTQRRLLPLCFREMRVHESWPQGKDVPSISNGVLGGFVVNRGLPGAERTGGLLDLCRAKDGGVHALIGLGGFPLVAGLPLFGIRAPHLLADQDRLPSGDINK